MQHLLEAPVPLAELRPDLPEGLVEVIERLMAKAPADRYQTAAEVVLALGSYAEQDTGIDWASATAVHTAGSPVVRELASAVAEQPVPLLPGVIRRTPLSIPVLTVPVPPVPVVPPRRPQRMLFLASGLFVLALLTVSSGLGLYLSLPQAANDSGRTSPSDAVAASTAPTGLLGTPLVSTAASTPISPTRALVRQLLELGVRVEILPPEGTTPIVLSPNRALPPGHIHVVAIDCSERPRMSDSTLGVLQELTTLRTINVSGTRVTGAFLKLLTHHTELTSLRLNDSDLREENLAALSQFPNLRSLSLGKATLTPVGMHSLTSLRKLRDLDLEGTTVDDEALQALPNLPDLETLNLAGTQVTDQGLEHLGRFRRLRGLVLDDLPITDAGLEHLVKLSLDRLRLNRTQITDRGIAAIGTQATLRSVSVSHTSITSKGVAELRRLLPNCRVEYSPPQRNPARPMPPRP
jgi:hypothetical protein